MKKRTKARFKEQLLEVGKTCVKCHGPIRESDLGNIIRCVGDVAKHNWCPRQPRKKHPVY